MDDLDKYVEARSGRDPEFGRAWAEGREGTVAVGRAVLSGEGARGGLRLALDDLQQDPRRPLRHAPPLLGQHTEPILRELGCSDAEITELRERRVI